MGVGRVRWPGRKREREYGGGWGVRWVGMESGVGWVLGGYVCPSQWVYADGGVRWVGMENGSMGVRGGRGGDGGEGEGEGRGRKERAGRGGGGGGR